MKESTKWHEVPQNGWLKVWTRCRETLEDCTVCPDCNGKGEKTVNVSISNLTAHIKKELMRELAKEMSR